MTAIFKFDLDRFRMGITYKNNQTIYKTWLGWVGKDKNTAQGIKMKTADAPKNMYIYMDISPRSI